MQSGKNVYYAARSIDCSDMLLNMSQLAVIGGDGTLTLNWEGRKEYEKNRNDSFGRTFGVEHLCLHRRQ